MVASVKRSLLLSYQSKLLEIRKEEEQRVEECKKAAAAVAAATSSVSAGDSADSASADDAEIEVDIVVDRRAVYKDMCARICQVCLFHTVADGMLAMLPPLDGFECSMCCFR
jgi:hypothetical protein